jgi:hypothetical protein
MLLPHAESIMTSGMSGYSWMGPGTCFLGLLAAFLARWDEADAHFADATARLAALGARPILAQTRYQWARAFLARGGHEERARALLDEAGAEAEALGMSGLVAAVERKRGELRGAPAAAPASPATPAGEPPLVLRREGEYWTVEWGSAPAVRLRDSRGLQILATLVANPGREIHAIDLANPSTTGDSVAGGVGIDTGDAGELLDDEARAAYRERIDELRETIAEAESFGDAGRRERAQAELEALTAELARAVGLGGRARRAGSAAERARVAVQRRLKDALERIAEAAPDLGDHLARTVYTGAFCSYRPAEPRRPRQFV